MPRTCLPQAGISSNQKRRNKSKQEADNQIDEGKQSSRALASENLVNQNFNATQRNQIWTSDITYLWTKQGWLYLAVVMDVYSGKIVGCSTQSNLSTELVQRALVIGYTAYKSELRDHLSFRQWKSVYKQFIQADTGKLPN
jgi:transposase InsO family protein